MLNYSEYNNWQNFKINVSRLEPQFLKGQKIAGYLGTYYLPTTVPDIIEDIGLRYGGGKFLLKVIDDQGKYVKSKTFEIAGIPKTLCPAELRILEIINEYRDDLGYPSAVLSVGFSGPEICYVLSKIPREEWPFILSQLPTEKAAFWAEQLRSHRDTRSERLSGDLRGLT
jgi:hypothetical protein